MNGLAIIRLQPQTGRTHQLRVQCALRGISIVGDKNYGDFTFNRKIARATKVDRLCLHAGEIEFKLVVDGVTINFFADSPIPRSMGKLVL
jgi:23S rRNA pseudouridine955/2504/2580 synthase